MEESKEIKGEVLEVSEKEHSKIAQVIGFCAGVAAVSFAGVALNQVDTSSMKGIMKILKPIGIFGIAHWIGNNAADAAMDEVDEYAEGIQKVSTFVQDFKNEMKSNEEVEANG